MPRRHPPALRRSLAWVALSMAGVCGSAHAADFAAAGAKALLTVDYLYASSGRKSSQGMYDPYEWRVKRNLSLEAQLAAQRPTAMPTVQAMDASQAAKLRKMGGMRYQAWRPTAQKGTYVIDERVRMSVTDPICASKPKHRCTREETRKGSGEVPVAADARSRGDARAAAGISAVELDARKGLLTIGLPVPLGMLPYTETITSDEPDGTYDTPIARGSRKRENFFRVSASGSGFMHDKPLTVVLKGGWRDQAGEQVVKLLGEFGNGGTLTVRWRFKVL